nr:SPOR domain-containing protein [Gilvimarinus xylanilyticus]
MIFLPGFFKEQQLHQVDTRSQIPPRPDTAPVVINTPRPVASAELLPDPDKLFIPDSEQPLLDAEQTQSSSFAASSVAQASSSTPSSAASSSVTSQPESSPADSEGLANLDAWVVQVASLRSAESAQQLRKKLQDKGYKAYVRLAKTSQGEVSRVFIGPKVDKGLAEAVKTEIDPAFKVNSLVLKFKP